MKGNVLWDYYVKGHMKGHVKGHMKGNVKGHMKGNVKGHMKGNVKGHMKGHVKGHMKGNVLSSEGNVLGEALFHGPYEGTCLPKYWSLKKVVLRCKISSNSILIPLSPAFFLIIFFRCVCVHKQPD